MDAPPPGASGPPGPPAPGPARVDSLAAREAALAAREAAVVAREAAAAASQAAAAGLAQWAQDLATWAQRRLHEADASQEYARRHSELAHARQRELAEAIYGVSAERDRLHDVCARLAAKEDELMLRESALGLAPTHPPLAYPLIASDSPNSLYSPVPATPPPDDDSDPLV
jgi:hypothetical protein